MVGVGIHAKYVKPFFFELKWQNKMDGWTSHTRQFRSEADFHTNFMSSFESVIFVLKMTNHIGGHRRQLIIEK